MARRAPGPGARWATSPSWRHPRTRVGPRRELRFQLLDLHDIVDATVEEGPGRLAAGRAVVQPVEQRRGIDAGQRRPLGIEIEIGAGIAGGVPQRVDRIVEKLQRQRRIEGQRQQRKRPPHRLAFAGMTFEADAHRLLDAIADLEIGDALLFHVLDRALVGALAEMSKHLARAAGEQAVGLARRQLEAARRRGQRGAAPAVEGGLLRDGIGEPVAQGGIRVVKGAGLGAHWGKYRQPGGASQGCRPVIPTPPSVCPRNRSRAPSRAWKEAIEVQVLVRENNVDQALRVLKKKMQREGIFREMKLRRNYEKPSERRARERAEAIRRTRKLMRKRLEREGY